MASFAAADGTVTVRAHGAPFNVAGMDAIELGHFIKGQASKAMAGAIERVNLVSCESAIDFRQGKVSTGQVLADFLGADVYAFREEVNSLNARLAQSSAGKQRFGPRVKVQGESAALLRQIEKDRAKHMYWHNAVTNGAGKIASLRASILARSPRAADNPRELDRVLQRIAAFVVGKTSVIEFFQYMYPAVRDTEQGFANFEMLSFFAEQAASASDEQCLRHLLAILSMKPEWEALVERE